MIWILKTMLTGATLIGSSLFAFAGEGEGIIDTINLDTRTITLADGSKWEVDDGIDLDNLVTGDTIYVIFEDGTSRLISVNKIS